MLIVTPILIGQTLHPKVIESAAKLKAPWLVVSMDAAYPNYEREISINFTRAKLHSEALGYISKISYILLLDSDVVINNIECVEVMKKMLNNGYTAACLKTKESDHILGSCALVKADFYKNHLGPTDNPFECQCKRLSRLGKIGYVDGFDGYEINRI